MFGRKKHCTICGMDVQDERLVKRFGKAFCSDEHANEYTEIKKSQLKDEQNYRRRRGGGCC